MIQLVGRTKVEDEDRERAAMWLASNEEPSYDAASIESLARAFAGARSVEREACAKVVEKVHPITMGYGGTSPTDCRTWDEPNPVARACAAAIRMRNAWEPVGPASPYPSEGQEP